MSIKTSLVLEPLCDTSIKWKKRPPSLSFQSVETRIKCNTNKRIKLVLGTQQV
jgi:hypothetical protein